MRIQAKVPDPSGSGSTTLPTLLHSLTPSYTPTPGLKNQNTIKVKITLGSRKINIIYRRVGEGAG